MTRKIPFLPLFFAALCAILAVLIFIRVREYGASEAVAADLPATTSRASIEDRNGGLVQDDRGTIVPVANDGTADATEPASSAAQSAREQRYRELLAAPPPPAAPQAPAEKPSLLQRLVSPITNAFGGGAANKPVGTPAPPPAARPPQQRAPQAQPHDPQASHGGRGNEPGNGSGSEQPEDDPTSDRTPPQIVTIEFQPPQVQDGSETILIVNAMDDKSGVRSISGSISSPSGGLQGFACQREPETNRYLARIAVPKDAAEGVWHVNYLTLSDNASNSINLSWAQGQLPSTASFKVTSSRSDSSGPTLKAVWLDRIAMRAGEKNTLFIQAEDDKAGVNLISGVFQSPSKHARVGFGCRSGSSGTWECEVSMPSCLDCGIWQLETVQLQDKANNMATVRLENQLVSAVKVDVTGAQCDNQQPVLTAVVLDKTAVSNAEPTTIAVTVQASDDLCGVSNISGQALGPPGPGGQARIFFSFSNAGDPSNWIGRLQVPRLAAKGMWSIAWIQVMDRGNNLRTYSANEPALANAKFNVQ
ncbi:MAG TPA: hypothetical protein VGF69_15760 [Thermoanaerobaculia bacterium]|jgi:hypothetical protein